VTATVGRLTIAPLTQDEAEQVADWRYEPPYDFYDTSSEQRDFAELLDPMRRGDRYFSARDTAGQLVGYFGFACSRDAVGIGLGLRPDLTGRGLGRSFLEEGLRFARGRFRPRRFWLQVAEFNVRAITVYERCGFVRTRSFLHETNGGVFTLVELERPP
jgi:ribosomal-protein-alanine N-acetyltransferase